MKKIAIVAATPFEVQPLVDFLNKHYPSIYPLRYQLPHIQLHIWITGVGIMSTVFHLSRWLNQTPVDWVVNAGIAGSFRREWALGTVVAVTADRLGDCGVEDADGNFTDVFDMGLTDPNEPPFINGKLYNPAVAEYHFLPQAQGITVHRVTGTLQNIEAVQSKYQPDIETMEGAAFHYVCLLQHCTFLQVRAISNYVEPRDKTRWDIPLAIHRLNETLLQMLLPSGE